MARLSMAELRHVTNIVNCFEVEEGSIDLIEAFGAGRINVTYKVTIRNRDKRYEYLIQNVNNDVFVDTKGLMENVVSVTNFVRSKGGKALCYIKCKSSIHKAHLRGPYIYVDNLTNKHWRMYHYIDADVYPCIIKPHHAYMLGEAIASFSKSLDGFDTQKLVETIPDFHDTPKRFSAFLLSVANDSVWHRGRMNGIEKEVDFIIQRSNQLGVMMDALHCGEIPYRVAHNDPKINNVLFDKETSNPICMIDLDTVMPGTGLFDVGDALRSIANSASEDDKTTENVSFSMEVYAQFVKGYLSEMGDKLTKREKELIPISVWIMTMELGIRFLKDHIDGNKYFKFDYDGQNIERARIQLALAEDIEKKMDELKSMIE